MSSKPSTKVDSKKLPSLDSFTIDDLKAMLASSDRVTFLKDGKTYKATSYIGFKNRDEPSGESK